MTNDGNTIKKTKAFETYQFAGMALDPIHVGTGGTRLGRVDSTIVRDPVTRIPKIPGSSLAGVMRAYTAMAKEKYPHCAGLGQPERDGAGGHCGQADCPVCTVFGFAKGIGPVGIRSTCVHDMQVLLSRSSLGTTMDHLLPAALRQTGIEAFETRGSADSDHSRKSTGLRIGHH